MVVPTARENTDEKRFQIYSNLKAVWDGEKLPYGVKGEIAKKHKVSRWTVSKYWKLGIDVSEPEDAWKKLRSKKKGNVGRKKLDADQVISELKSLPIRQRRTYRHAAKSTTFSRCGLWNAVKRGDIKRRSSGLSPALTNKNKLERLQCCLSFIDPETGKFHSMRDRIHVDEK